MGDEELRLLFPPGLGGRDGNPRGRAVPGSVCHIDRRWIELERRAGSGLVGARVDLVLFAAPIGGLGSVAFELLKDVLH